MAYLPIGFLPEEEQEVLSVLRAQQEFRKKQEETQKRDEYIRAITAVATGFGFLLTLSQLGHLIGERRRARATV